MVTRSSFARTVLAGMTCVPLLVQGASAPGYPATDPEALLTAIFDDIEESNLRPALDKVSQLVDNYPKFKLAQLIKGDLLLAQANPLTQVGGHPDVPANELEDLREESVVRLKAQKNRPSKALVPTYLLNLAEDQTHAIVVDTSRSRLYLYRNEEGVPHMVSDFYIAQGKAGVGKQKEGDSRTPLGVYFLMSQFKAKSLPDLYGSGAFPLNYPNEWDRQNGREGHGIWLHGTPSDTYSRPPKSSQGCLVLTNQDLAALSHYIQPGKTHIIISNSVEWVEPEELEEERAQFLTLIENWRKIWEGRAIDSYMSYYSPDFRSNKGNYADWEAHKRKVAAAAKWVKIDISQVSIFKDPQDPDLRVVTFKQTYQSNTIKDSSWKRLYWHKENNLWRIVFEDSGKL